MSPQEKATERAGRTWRLRTRLAVGLGLLCLAVFTVVAVSHFQNLKEQRDEKLTSMNRVSETVAAAFDGLAYDLETFSKSTAITLGDARVPTEPPPSDDRRKSINDYLYHLFETHGLLRAIFITDTSGRVVYSQDGVSSGVDLSNRTYIQALQRGATEFWSEGFPGSESGDMVFTHARPIFDPDGKTTGYLVIAVYTEALASRLPDNLVTTGHLSIIDNNGTLVLRVPDDDAAEIGADLSGWAAVAEARQNDGATVEDKEMPLGTGDRYGAVVPMDKLGWLVAYSVPASDIAGSTTDLFYRDLLILGAIVLAAFGAMWVFANQTVSPLTRLTDMAKGISRGEVATTSFHVDSGNAEVLLLADAMEQMRVAVKTREEELRAQTHANEAIERFAESTASELDIDRAVQSIIQAGVDLVSADAAQFVLREGIAQREQTAVAGSKPSLALPEDDPLIHAVLDGRIIDISERESTAPAPRDQDNGHHLIARRVLGVPVRGREDAVEGALVLLRGDGEGYTSHHRRLAVGLARWAGIVLENARLYSKSQELVADLAKSNQAKSDFLGIVSHELRTPITTIYGGTLLLRTRRDSLPEQAFDDMIVSISEEAERLHHLVEDLLAIARTDLASDLRALDLADVVAFTVRDFSTTHRRVVEVRVGPDVPAVLADQTYVRQVVHNLISNADKYTPLDSPVEVTATFEHGEVHVSVTDHGSGIAEAELTQIFDSFYRSKDAAERASGSGLGLTVCKRLVEAMGGKIWARNRDEGGLEVSFTLRPAEAPRTAEPVPGARGGGSGTNGTSS